MSDGKHVPSALMGVSACVSNVCVCVVVSVHVLVVLSAMYMYMVDYGFCIVWLGLLNILHFAISL